MGSQQEKYRQLQNKKIFEKDADMQRSCKDHLAKMESQQNPTKQFKGEKIMKKLTFAELEMVNGGDAVAAEAYLRELRKKCGGKSPLETLARATSEEVDYLMALYEM